MTWRSCRRPAAVCSIFVALQIGTISSSMARAPIVPAGQTFICTASRVWDGDGPVWCREGPRLRLADIAAREHDGSCRPGQPCPRASGIAARDALVQLLGGARGMTSDGHVLVHGPAMRCLSRGPDRYGRTVASCRTAGGDLGTRLIAASVVLPWHLTGRKTVLPVPCLFYTSPPESREDDPMLDAELIDTRRTKPAFGRWLLSQSTRTDAIGELAKSAARDPAFPRDGTADQVSCRLNAIGADGDMHEALEDAQLDWASC